MIPRTYSSKQSSTGSDLAELVAFLSSGAAYSFAPASVETKETHMSWVFLVNEHVFKLKKPVCMPFLDFSTLKAREKFCKEEVKLNRRLAPDVYLGVTPVTRTETGDLAIAGRGCVVDWLVEMRRLPAARMLDHAIAERTATREDFDRVFDLLFSFFARSAPLNIEEDQYVATLKTQHAQNRIVLLEGDFDFSPIDVPKIIEIFQSVLNTRPDWLLEPVRSRRIIEGHGDLRPEHICLTEPPVVIDCLEFNAALRRLDPFDELSFLALECRLLGAADIADAIVPQYAERIGVKPPQALLDFYTAHRATIRARLAIAHLLDPPPQDIAKWTTRARAYLLIAQEAILNLSLREAP